MVTAKRRKIMRAGAHLPPPTRTRTIRKRKRAIRKRKSD